MSNLCVRCKVEVRPRQHAIQCDNCASWTHRLCGTGITLAVYRHACRTNADIVFQCEVCILQSFDRSDSTTHQTSNLSTHDHTTTSTTPVSDATSTTPVSDATSTTPASDATSTSSTTPSADASFAVDRSFTVPDPVHEESVCQDDDRVQAEEQPFTVQYDEVELGTERGKRKLTDTAGFHYTFKKMKGDTTHWRCSKRSKTLYCPATVIQRGSTYHPGLKEHIHPPEPGSQIAVKIKAETKRQATQSLFSKSAPQIVEDAIRAHGDCNAPEPSRPKVSNLIRAVNRERQGQRPEDPRDLDFILDEYFLDTNTPDLHREDIYVGSRRHLLLYTDLQLKLLADAKTWYMDGTFRVVNHPWKQLFTINAFIKSNDNVKQVPLMFCFMSGLSEDDYYEVFRAIDHHLHRPIAFERAVLDFERAVWNALDDRFPWVKVQGCVFHWNQAVFRKVKEKGLQSAYNQRGDVYDYLRQVMALPFLPYEHILDTFLWLDDRADSQPLKDVMDYVYINWITSRTFHPKYWSVFYCSIRTNNDCEGWHNRLNTRTSTRGPVPFYLLITELHKEATNIPMQVRLLGEDKLARHQRKQTTTREGKLFALWDQYKARNISTTKLLRMCARIYGPSVSSS